MSSVSEEIPQAPGGPTIISRKVTRIRTLEGQIHIVETHLLKRSEYFRDRLIGLEEQDILEVKRPAESLEIFNSGDTDLITKYTYAQHWTMPEEHTKARNQIKRECEQWDLAKIKRILPVCSAQGDEGLLQMFLRILLCREFKKKNTERMVSFPLSSVFHGLERDHQNRILDELFACAADLGKISTEDELCYSANNTLIVVEPKAVEEKKPSRDSVKETDFSDLVKNIASKLST